MSEEYKVKWATQYVSVTFTLNSVKDKDILEKLAEIPKGSRARLIKSALREYFAKGGVQYA